MTRFIVASSLLALAFASPEIAMGQQQSATEGPATTQIDKSPAQSDIADDYAAQNLAYQAYNGDAGAATKLSVLSKDNPAYLWGLYELDLLKWQDLKAVPDNPLLDDATDPIMQSNDPKWYSNLVAIRASQANNGSAAADASKQYRAMMAPLVHAASEHDPAAEDALAKEHWAEISRSATMADYLGVKSQENPTDTVSEFTSADNGEDFAVWKTFCQQGLDLALEAKGAGWPEAYVTLSLYATPTSGGPNDDGYVAEQLTTAAGCEGQSIPDYSGSTPDVSLLEAGANAGAVDAIGAEIAGNKDSPDIQARWINRLTALAKQGNEAAAYELLDLHKFGVIPN